MKKNVLKTELAALVLLLFSLGVMAQNGNKDVITQNRDVATFDGIKVSGVFKIIFTQGEPQTVKIETDANLMDKITTEVKGGILDLSTKGSINSPSSLNVYITAKDLKSLELSGASKFKATNKINSPQLKIDLSGISAATLTADAQTVRCDISGVCKLDIQGTGDQLTADVSGTGKLLASRFEVKDVKVNTSGVGSATINASATGSFDASGASNIRYIPNDNLDIKNKTVTGVSHITRSGSESNEEASEDIKQNNNRILNHNLSREINRNINRDLNRDFNQDISAEVNTNGDSTKIKIGNLNIDVIEGPQTEVRLGRNKLIVDENGKVQFSKKKRDNAFHSHWSGIYIGTNGYLTPSGKLDPPVHDNFMSLNQIKSTNVQLNLFEQNLKISDHTGFVTGLGIEYRNYRFDQNNVVLQNSANSFDGQLKTDANYKKSKLLVTYLTVPLLFELQTNRFTNHNSFHIAGGVSTGLRIGSHSKVKFENTDGGTQKSKNRSDFNLNPFKLDATALVGWGNINLYGNYGLVDMFKIGNGPELRPFSFGLRLVFD